MTTSRAADRDRRGGYALLETMFALVVVGLLAALALPRTAPGADDPVRAAAALASLLRADRQAALEGRRVVTTRMEGGAVVAGDSGAVLRLDLALSGALVRRGGVTWSAAGGATGGDVVLAAGDRTAAVRVNGFTGAVEVVGR